MSAITIHPEFDPETLSWFWDEYEAPTLRELSALLGPNVVIADYYPRGIDKRIKEVFLTFEERLSHLSRLKRTGRIEFGDYVRRSTVVRRAEKALHEAQSRSTHTELRMVRAGTTNRPPVTPDRVIAGVRPDPVYRERVRPGPTGPQRRFHERNAKIVALWQQKLSAKEILRALDLRLTERAVWIIVRKARQSGDEAAKSHRRYEDKDLRRALPDNQATRRALSQQRSETDVHQAS